MFGIDLSDPDETMLRVLSCVDDRGGGDAPNAQFTCSSARVDTLAGGFRRQQRERIDCSPALVREEDALARAFARSAADAWFDLLGEWHADCIAYERSVRTDVRVRLR
jgi:hypothetical protein